MMNKNNEHIKKNPDTMVYPLELKFNRQIEAFDMHKAVGNVYGNRAIVEMSEILQQRDYARCGYVSEDTRDEIGRLPEDLDKARGNNVVTVLAVSKKLGGRVPNAEESFSPGNKEGIATIRFAYPQSKQPESARLGYSSWDSIATLPSYDDVFKDHFEKNNPDPSVRDVKRYIEMHGSKSVAEVSSMASENSPSALFEVIRDVIQCQYVSERPEIWIAAIVEKPFRALESRLGSRFIHQIGEPYAFGDKDDGVHEAVKLVPTVMHVDQWPELMASEILDNTTSVAQRRRMQKMLKFLLDGMPPEKISPITREALIYGENNEAI